MAQQNKKERNLQFVGASVDALEAYVTDEKFEDDEGGIDRAKFEATVIAEKVRECLKGIIIGLKTLRDESIPSKGGILDMEVFTQLRLHASYVMEVIQDTREAKHIGIETSIRDHTGHFQFNQAINQMEILLRGILDIYTTDEGGQKTRSSLMRFLRWEGVKKLEAEA